MPPGRTAGPTDSRADPASEPRGDDVPDSGDGAACEDPGDGAACEDPGDGARCDIDWQAALASHDRWLRTVAFARLGRRDAVDEVMQEVALAVLRRRAPLRDAARLAPWLYRVTVLQSLLYRRAVGRRRKLLSAAARLAPETAYEDGAAYDPLAWLAADESRQHVRTAVGRLPPRDAEIVLLKYTESWSYRQIAEHLGIGEAAVEARLHRARKRLRAELAALSLAYAG